MPKKALFCLDFAFDFPFGEVLGFETGGVGRSGVGYTLVITVGVTIF